MDLIKQHLESISGIELYPIIAFIIFLVIFVGVLFYTFSLTRKELKEMKELPLQDDNMNITE